MLHCHQVFRGHEIISSWNDIKTESESACHLNRAFEFVASEFGTVACPGSGSIHWTAAFDHDQIFAHWLCL